MGDVAVKVEGVGKRYRIGEAQRPRYGTLRDALASFAGRQIERLRHPFGKTRREPSTIWALKDVSFEVGRGEVIGIIGRNGAGKSTLLKILSRITEPTEGRVTLHGRVGSLLEVGTGFHLELTGRENIYLNGAILGMKKVEIDRKFDEIVAFAEVEKFIDTPVKHYSSGMHVRLAFAVAAHLEPEILLVDEVLAVGDAAFQKKCLGKMGDVARGGRTILFVSHNMRAVNDLCDTTVWMDEGRPKLFGATDEVVVSYLGSLQPGPADGVISTDMHINATGHVYFRRAHVLDSDGRPTSRLLFGEPLQLELALDVRRPVEDMRLIVAIERADGTLIAALNSTDDGSAPFSLQVGSYNVSLVVPLHLMPGGHVIHLGAKPVPGYWGAGMSWDWVQGAAHFTIDEISTDGSSVPPARALVSPPSKWQLRTRG